jgi:hypothetical protein
MPGENKDESRRDFVKTSAQVAITAPAVALLLSGSTKQALAQPLYVCAAGLAGCPPPHHILDDFTFGNENEDIDAIQTGSNFNFLDGKPQQDDHVWAVPRWNGISPPVRSTGKLTIGVAVVAPA